MQSISLCRVGGCSNYCSKPKGKDSELKSLQELVSDVLQSKTVVAQKTLNHAKYSRAQLKNQLCQMLQNGNTSVHHVLEQWQREQGDYFEAQMTSEMHRLDAEATVVSRLLLNTQGHLPLDEEQQNADEGGGFSKLAGSLIQKGLKLGYKDADVARGMIEVMKQGKQWFPSLAA